MGRLTTDEFIKKAQEIHKNKYDYSKVTYVNNQTKVCIICPEHGEFWQTPSNHLQGYGCQKCGGTLKSTTETFINKAQEIHNNKYDYSKVKYLNASTKVCIICPKHGEFWQTPHNHLHGQECPKCHGKNLTNQEFIAQCNIIHNGKYNYSKVNYVNAKTKICIICPEHGEFLQTPSSHLTGCGCPKCKANLSKQNLTMSKSEFVIKANNMHHNKYDYSKVDMLNRDDNGKVCIICPEHGEFWQTPHDHLQGKGCPTCVHHQSKAEIEIIETLQEYLLPEQIIQRDRDLLDGQEVDILLPDFHVGIEFNGLYWHNLKHKPDLNYHKKKMELANHKGYRLIQIFEDEWIERKEVVLNKLRHVVNGDEYTTTIGARKTIVRQINKEIAKVFLEQYHIQGYVGSSVYLGAYYGEELVGVMSFTEEQPKMWNLTRFTTKTEYKLPGLASKMFKYFLTNFEHEEIKSFLDLRWNQSLNGNTVYDKLGFVLEKTIRPDYRYVVGNQRIHKFNMRKQTLNRKYGLPLTMTEREMCNELGFERIYDCGLAKYVFKEKS